MNLRRTYDYHAGREYSVAGAVEAACDGADYDRGSVETAEATAEATAANTMRLVGRLVETLREKNVLDDRDVLKILDGAWEVV